MVILGCTVIMLHLFSNSEWILLFDANITEGVVDAPVVIFVRSDGQDDISHQGILPQFPVVDSYLRCRQSAPHGQLSLVELLEYVGVGDDSLLLQVANKPDGKV